MLIMSSVEALSLMNFSLFYENEALGTGWESGGRNLGLGRVGGNNG